MLGYHQKDGNNLDRAPPCRSPFYPWLVCTRVTYQGIGFNAQSPSINNRYGSAANYQFARMTCTYANPPCNLYWQSLGDQGNEWLRYTTINVLPQAQEISLGEGAMTFKEGNLPASNGPKGTDVPGSPVKIVQGDVLEINWFKVPHYYLMGTTGYRAGNIIGYGSAYNAGLNQTYEGATGKTNKNAFLGYDANTLLMKSPVITPGTQSVCPAWNGDQLQLRTYDIKFQFAIWDPKLGPTATTHGWGTALWRGDKLAYYAEVKGTGAGTTPLYAQYPFENLFAAANATLLA